MKFLRWLVITLCFLFGLIYLTGSVLAGLLLILIGVFFIPNVQSKIPKKFTRKQKILFLIVGFIFSTIMLGIGIGDKTKEEAFAKLDLLKTAIHEGEIETVDTLKEELQNSTDREIKTNLEKLRSLESKSTSVNSAKEELVNMTDEEFAKLSTKTLSKSYIEYDYLNKKFIELLFENKDIRSELILAKKEELAKLKIKEAERKKQEEADKIAKEAIAKLEERTKKVEKGFSAWDGSHVQLTRLIKKNMNDPDSYDHAETTYIDKTDYLIVKTTYRGKNAFGGIVLGSITAKVSLEGSVLEIIDN